MDQLNFTEEDLAVLMRVTSDTQEEIELLSSKRMEEIEAAPVEPEQKRALMQQELALKKDRLAGVQERNKKIVELVQLVVVRQKYWEAVENIAWMNQMQDEFRQATEVKKREREEQKAVIEEVLREQALLEEIGVALEGELRARAESEAEEHRMKQEIMELEEEIARVKREQSVKAACVQEEEDAIQM